METNIIYNIDCLTGGIDSLPDKSIDYAFTSPPYNRKRNDKYSKYDDTLEDYYGFLLKVTEKLRRVVKHHIFLNVQTNYYNKADVYRFIGTYADYIQNIIIWEKSNPMPANGFMDANILAMKLFQNISKKLKKELRRVLTNNQIYVII